jgi:hypothetical protein
MPVVEIAFAFLYSCHLECGDYVLLLSCWICLVGFSFPLRNSSSHNKTLAFLVYIFKWIVRKRQRWLLQQSNIFFYYNNSRMGGTKLWHGNSNPICFIMYSFVFDLVVKASVLTSSLSSHTILFVCTITPWPQAFVVRVYSRTVIIVICVASAWKRCT